MIGKKEIVIDAFTDSEAICDFFPISPAAKYMPEWWKKMPKQTTVDGTHIKNIPNATIKTCDGLTSLYKNSIIIPIWNDLIIETKADGQYAYQWSSSEGGFIDNNSLDTAGPAVRDHVHIKLTSPWFLKEKTGVHFVWHQPTWNMLDNELFDYNVLPGKLEFRYQYTSNINILFPKKNKRTELKAGTPMAMLTPLSERPIKVKCHQVDPTEIEKFKNYQNARLVFTGHYRNFFKKNPNR